MKYLIFLIVLSGCNGRVEQWEINKAVDFCGSLSSIQQINLYSISDNRVDCVNGKRAFIKSEYE